VRRNWVQNHRRSLRENGYWVANLQSSLTEGTDPATILEVEKEIQALSAHDIQVAARRYFDTSNYVQVVMNPEQPVTGVATAVVTAAATPRAGGKVIPGG
jgi:zinc protease